jgi:antibiotic biosynthesis monooxygenase (ABM) superfamily enzyme
MMIFFSLLQYNSQFTISCSIYIKTLLAVALLLYFAIPITIVSAVTNFPNLYFTSRYSIS